MPSPDHIMGVVVAILLALACLAPRLGSSVLDPIESFGMRLAEKRGLSVALIAAAPALLRITLLPILPIPVPDVGDEFSYLLAADTFTHGRLANPPHPMWIYFDTFHVNQHPAYMSKYPPAQGAILAIGQLLGHPWIGVLLSASAMCAAVVWMLQGWLPPRWALLGGVLVVLRLGVFGYWMNSYWGGFVAATGGAMVIGALPRLLRSHRPRDSMILGSGIAILANSRPFEGLIFCLPVAAVLIVWLFGSRSPTWRRTIPRIVAPSCTVLAACGIFMACYNWRGTGSPFLLPYTINNQAYLSTPSLVWQKLRAPLQYANPQFDAFYNDLSRSEWLNGQPDTVRHALRILARDANRLVRMFLWPELCVPLLALPWILLDRRIRFLIVQAAICCGGFLLVAWFLPHYAAPLVATTFAIITQGIRHLRQWRPRERPLGISLSRAIVASAVLLAPIHLSTTVNPKVPHRAWIAAQLEVTPGNHLVIVRYSAKHNVHGEWVYNRADIDHAKVVWAREIPGVAMQPLLDYFRSRKVWLVEPDSSERRLSPYPNRTQSNDVFRDFSRTNHNGICFATNY
jgi:hypothetical protein